MKHSFHVNIKYKLNWYHYNIPILGWEFQFLVLISGTPIRSGIPIPFLIPKIPVGFFLNSAVEKSRNLNSDSKNWNSKKNKRRKSIHLISHAMSIVIGQPVGFTMSSHMDIGTTWQRQS